MTQTLARPPAVPQQTTVGIVDCDVHVVPRSLDELLDYMPDAAWSERIHPRQLRMVARPGFNPLWENNRLDAAGENGATPGSVPDVLRRQLFGEAGVDFAMLMPLVPQTFDDTVNAFICRASNAWQAATWLGEYNADNRFFGSINVPVNDPESAVREIEAWAGHASFKQVLITHHGPRAFGHREYEPIWAAAARHRLPVAMHFGSAPGESPAMTPTGHFMSHVEYHSLAFPGFYSAHLLSWICGGVFDRLPDFRVVFVEGGFLWHRPMLARLARQWRSTSSGTAALRDNPLDYVREHVRFTSQPIEESDRSRDVASLLELAEANRVLMFSSDYPHFDFDHPARALPPQLDKETRRRIMSENARELYGLPATRLADSADA